MKNKNRKKVLKLCAVIIACVTFVTGLFTAVFAASSIEMTRQRFEERLASFKSSVYPDGSTYIDNIAEYRGTQCFGFANQISKYVFGSFPTAYGSGKKLYSNNWEINRGAEALSHLHIGDVVRYRSSTSADHSIFVTGMDDEYVYFSDANNDHRNTVRHNAKITWTKLTDRIERALESDSSYIGFVAHFKYWDDETVEPEPEKVTVSYNANGAVIDSARTGDLYRVITPEGLNIRNAPGIEGERIVTMKYESVFYVPDGTERVEANGYVWANVHYGEYVGWSAVSDSEFCAIIGEMYDSEYYVDAQTSDIFVSASGARYTYELSSGKELEGGDKFGLYFEDTDLGGWSLTPDGDPVTAAELLRDHTGQAVVLYAIPVRIPETEPETGTEPVTEPDPGTDPGIITEQLTVSYNANGGYTETGKLGDRYKVIVYDGLIIREGPGLSNKKIITMHSGSIFDVYDSTEKVESDGYTWAKVRYENYTGWSAVSDSEFCVIIGQIDGGTYCLGGSGSDVCVSATGALLVHIIDESSSLLDCDDLGLRFPGMKFIGWSETPDGETVTLDALRAAHTSGSVTLYAVWEKLPDPPAGPALPGDVNGDGKLNNRDVVLLFKNISEGNIENAETSDVNGDGIINNKDIVALFRLVSGETGE